jgi:hypothetical protein
MKGYKMGRKKNILMINIEYYAAVFGIGLGRIVPLSVGYAIVNIFARILFLIDKTTFFALLSTLFPSKLPIFTLSIS